MKMERGEIQLKMTSNFNGKKVMKTCPKYLPNFNLAHCVGSPSNFTRWGITTAMENTFAPCYNFHIASAIQPKSVNTTMPCFNAKKYSSLISACHPKMVPKFHLGMSSFQACFLKQHYCARNSICT